MLCLRPTRAVAVLLETCRSACGVQLICPSQEYRILGVFSAFANLITTMGGAFPLRCLGRFKPLMTRQMTAPLPQAQLLLRGTSRQTGEGPRGRSDAPPAPLTHRPATFAPGRPTPMIAADSQICRSARCRRYRWPGQTPSRAFPAHHGDTTRWVARSMRVCRFRGDRRR